MSVLLLKHEKSHRPTFTNRTTLSVLFLRIGRNFLSYFNKHGKTKSVRSTFTERDNIVRPTHTLTNRTTFSVLLLPLQTGQYCPSYLYKQDKIPCPTLTNRTIFSVLPLQTGQYSPSYLYKQDNILRPLEGTLKGHSLGPDSPSVNYKLQLRFHIYNVYRV